MSPLPGTSVRKAREVEMKFAMIALLLLAALCYFALSRRRAAARDADAAAIARSRASARKPPVPAVSNNLKGVTASQTIRPVRPAARADDEYVDDR